MYARTPNVIPIKNPIPYTSSFV
uniref:Uncharacterized protein n=1 Tax=Rhizophora mucronata TaxID=61149 RepID=A0A2P2QGX6_RHIMU